MWQKPAQPSASIYRVEHVQQRPASARRSLSLSIRVPFVPASSLPFRPVALRSSSSSSSSLITVGVTRQQPVHRGQANFLPAVILFRPSLPLSLCSARRVNPPPSGAHNLPFSLSYPRAVIYHRAVGLCPFSSSPTRGGAAHPPAAHGCPSCSSTASHNVVLLLFPRLSYLNPFLFAMMQRALSISATLIDDNDFLASRLPGFLARDHATYLASFALAALVNDARQRASRNY